MAIEAPSSLWREWGELYEHSAVPTWNRGGVMYLPEHGARRDGRGGAEKGDDGDTALRAATQLEVISRTLGRLCLWVIIICQPSMWSTEYRNVWSAQAELQRSWRTSGWDCI